MTTSGYFPSVCSTTYEAERNNAIFPLSYSFLPCDRDFGVIEKLQTQRELVEIYFQWEDMITGKCNVIAMNGKDMLNFKAHFATFFKKSVTKMVKNSWLQNAKCSHFL